MRAAVSSMSAICCAIFLLAGCASPIHPAVIDTSSKVHKADVHSRFVRSAGGAGVSGSPLELEFQRAMQREAPRVSEGKLEVVAPGVGGATHLIFVDAQILNPTTVRPSYWNPCAYADRKGKCTGAMSGGGLSYSRVRMLIEVREHGTGKVVFRSDDKTSGTVAVDDRTLEAAARDAARAVLRPLKDSGLF